MSEEDEGNDQTKSKENCTPDGESEDSSLSSDYRDAVDQIGKEKVREALRSEKPFDYAHSKRDGMEDPWHRVMIAIGEYRDPLEEYVGGLNASDLE